MAQSEEGSECGVDEDLSRDIRSLRAVLEGDDLSWPGGMWGEEGESGSGEDGEGENFVDRLQQFLGRNQELQWVLLDQLRRIDVALAENRRKQSRLSQLMVGYKKKVLCLARFKRGSYFRDHKHKYPPSNSEVLLATPQGPLNFYTTENYWRVDKEALRLEEGVKQQVMDIRTQPLQQRLRKSTTAAETREAKRELTAIKRLSKKQLLKDVRQVNWNMLAYETFSGKKSALDCQLRWENFQSPTINSAPWNTEEDKLLLRLAREYDCYDWNTIAKRLNTKRTAFSCLQRYQQSLNPKRFKTEWSTDDDQVLKEAVAKYGEKNWSAVALHVGENCTGQQCLHRWYNSVIPGIKKGRWDPSEDEQLRKAVEHFGVGNWTRICTMVPSRTAVQCRERWVNVLDTNLNRGPWSSEEDKKLILLCQQYRGPISWSKVAARFGDRTDYMCSQRWKNLSSAGAIVTQYASRLKKKESIMNNFYGRRQCRPTLSAADIEDDLVPEATKMKVRNYEERIWKKKAREAGRAPHIPGQKTFKSVSIPTGNPEAQSSFETAPSVERSSDDKSEPSQTSSGSPCRSKGKKRQRRRNGWGSKKHRKSRQAGSSVEDVDLESPSFDIATVSTASEESEVGFTSQDENAIEASQMESAHPTPDVNATAHPTPDVNATTNPTPDVNATTNSTLDVNATSNPTPNVNVTTHPTPDVNVTTHPTPDVNTQDADVWIVSSTNHPVCAADVNIPDTSHLSSNVQPASDASVTPVCDTAESIAHTTAQLSSTRAMQCVQPFPVPASARTYSQPFPLTSVPPELFQSSAVYYLPSPGFYGNMRTQLLAYLRYYEALFQSSASASVGQASTLLYPGAPIGTTSSAYSHFNYPSSNAGPIVEPHSVFTTIQPQESVVECTSPDSESNSAALYASRPESLRGFTHSRHTDNVPEVHTSVLSYPGITTAAAVVSTNSATSSATSLSFTAKTSQVPHTACTSTTSATIELSSHGSNSIASSSIGTSNNTAPALGGNAPTLPTPQSNMRVEKIGGRWVVSFASTANTISRDTATTVQSSASRVQPQPTTGVQLSATPVQSSASSVQPQPTTRAQLSATPVQSSASSVQPQPTTRAQLSATAVQSSASRVQPQPTTRAQLSATAVQSSAFSVQPQSTTGVQLSATAVQSSASRVQLQPTTRAQLSATPVQSSASRVQPQSTTGVQLSATPVQSSASSVQPQPTTGVQLSATTVQSSASSVQPQPTTGVQLSATTVHPCGGITHSCTSFPTTPLAGETVSHSFFPTPDSSNIRKVGNRWMIVPQTPVSTPVEPRNQQTSAVQESSTVSVAVPVGDSQQRREQALVSHPRFTVHGESIETLSLLRAFELPEADSFQCQPTCIEVEECEFEGERDEVFIVCLENPIVASHQAALWKPPPATSSEVSSHTFHGDETTQNNHTEAHGNSAIIAPSQQEVDAPSMQSPRRKRPRLENCEKRSSFTRKHNSVSERRAKSCTPAMDVGSSCNQQTTSKTGEGRRKDHLSSGAAQESTTTVSSRRKQVSSSRSPRESATEDRRRTQSSRSQGETGGQSSREFSQKSSQRSASNPPRATSSKSPSPSLLSPGDSMGPDMYSRIKQRSFRSSQERELSKTSSQPPSPVSPQILRSTKTVAPPSPISPRIFKSS